MHIPIFTFLSYIITNISFYFWVIFDRLLRSLSRGTSFESLHTRDSSANRGQLGCMSNFSTVCKNQLYFTFEFIVLSKPRAFWLFDCISLFLHSDAKLNHSKDNWTGTEQVGHHVSVLGVLFKSFIASAAHYCCDISAAFHLTGVQCTVLINLQIMQIISHLFLLLALIVSETQDPAKGWGYIISI